MSRWALLKNALVVGKRETSSPQSIHRFRGFEHLIAKQKIIWRGFILNYNVDAHLERLIGKVDNDIGSELSWLIEDIISKCNDFMYQVDTNECALQIERPSTHHQSVMLRITEELTKHPFIRLDSFNEHTAILYVRHPTLDCTKRCEYWRYDLPSIGVMDGNNDVTIDGDSSTSTLSMFTREAPRDCGVTVRGVLSNQLVGVDNTGNICIWPAEAVLLYVLTTEVYFKQLIVGKRVLELGGGLTALAGLGLAIGRDGSCPEVVVTDGHPDCVRNQRVCIEMSRQSISCRSIGISAQLLHWSPAVNAVQVATVTENGTRPFDVIIASDCLFFREFHCDLVQTLRLLLSRDGVCLFLQPRRTHTMQSFVDKCDPYFHTEIMEDYSAMVSELRRNYLSVSEGSGYDDDIHYPIMLILRPK